VTHILLRGATALVLSCAAGTAHAQLSFGVGGGPSTPVGSLADGVGAGWHGGVVADLGVPLLPFSLRGDVMFQDLPGTAGGNSYRQFAATLNGRLGLLPLPLVSAYVTAGPGLYASSFDPAPGATNDRAVNSGINAGVGARVNLLVIRPFIEARFHRVFAEPARMFVPITVGVIF
jgi:hypothetical protein